MDEGTNKPLSQLLLAFKALSRSVEKGLLQGMYEGTGDVAVRGYRALHARAAGLLPDDYYVSEVLALELPDQAAERDKLAAVSLQASQMVDYLEGLDRAQRKAAVFSGPDMDEMRTLGRDLQEQILSVTRSTLKRAMANIDINIERPPKPPMPPEAPEPPEPPQPPKGKRKIEFTDEPADGEDDGII